MSHLFPAELKIIADRITSLNFQDIDPFSVGILAWSIGKLEYR